MMLLCRLLTLLLVLLSPVAVCAGELRLNPVTVVNGGTAVLRWIGPTPSFGVVRFNNRISYLYPDPGGAIALLPVPLDQPAGSYPLLGAVVDARGETTSFELELPVNRMERPQESLTLPERMVSPSDPGDIARIKQERTLLDNLFAQRSARLWDRFERPVDEPISSVFGKRRLLNGEPRAPHSGTDFRSPAGTAVRAISSGRVVLDEDLFYTGKTVVMDHGEELFSVYGHLSSIAVKKGQVVAAGEVLGRVGSTGRSTGPHLHLTVRLLGERVDPILFLGVLGEGQDS